MRRTGAIWVEGMRRNWHLSNRKNLRSGHGRAEDSAVDYCGRGWEQVGRHDAERHWNRGVADFREEKVYNNLVWLMVENNT